MNNEMNNTPFNNQVTNENVSLFAHEIIEHCSELDGLKVLLNNLYHEMEDGNRVLNTEQANREMLDAIYFSANALGMISKELRGCTKMVGC